ncbi:MAG TPA: SH3 domain-containing protein [Clostridia bacterium]
MKRLFCFFIFLLLSIVSVFGGFWTYPKKTHAQNGNLGYGLIVESKSVLYRNPVNSDTLDNIYFYLPETYFVEVLEKIDDVFYKVRYVDVVGYVKFSAINIKNYVPVSVFPTNLSLKINGDITVNVRSLPDTSSALITTLPSGTSVEYYNKTSGQELNSGSAYWYYVKINTGTQTLYGYVYSDYITLNSEIIYPNDISPMPVSNEKDPDEILNDKYTFWTQIIIALAVCIPIVFIIYLIFKPRKTA